MEFYHLRSFVAVAQTKNLTKAAQRLYTTPPAISAHIKALEDELATQLFIRSSKGMELTDKGQVLLTQAQRTLDSAVDLVNLAAINQHEIIGTLSISINAPAQQLALDGLAKKLHDDFPGITLDITAHSTGQAIGLLNDGHLDGAFIYGDLPSECASIKVKDQSLVVIAPSDVELTNELALPWLQQQRWVTMGGYCPFDSILRQRLGQPVNTSLSTDDESTRLSLVQQGLGFSLLEKELAKRAVNARQIIIIPAFEVSIPLQFIVQKTRANEPVIQALMQTVEVALLQSD
ncbi:LysR family transcriptional regulator [Psychrobium sp. 1_MG-2023]|uniref:LysR family transcriptional regulator n=1 Tax=Psychrobium sp. 1_MG-2023 TaxID=3062624 RepID=UPI000C34AAFD|nr:LysR family transcriptional regulator [Psychrobium sp. 1_MG-2023]MDP2559746.1 LysR family transcriptional regulator [Psychrobium sp. 1_MG-2023]PKF59144.1 LysR family transcriptional regulator [Alteromonadales bacterium alter-6D02]